MNCELDVDKDAENSAKHGISFEEATHIEKPRLIAVPKANRRARQVFYDYLTTRNSACHRPKRACICVWIRTYWSGSRRRGPGYHTGINAILRTYMGTH